MRGTNPKEEAFRSLTLRSQFYIKLMESRTDYEKLLEAIIYNEPSIVKFYLDSGVSVTPEEGSDTSPAFLAAAKMRPLILKMLLDYGANPNYEHRWSHRTILGSVFSQYDFMKSINAFSDTLNNLVMIAAIMRGIGQRFDTPNSLNKSPLDEFGLHAGVDRKEQVLTEFLEKIDRADLSIIRVADVVGQPPEEIVRLSSEEEQKVSLYRNGRYNEIPSRNRVVGLGLGASLSARTIPLSQGSNSSLRFMGSSLRDHGISSPAQYMGSSLRNYGIYSRPQHITLFSEANAQAIVEHELNPLNRILTESFNASSLNSTTKPLPAIGINAKKLQEINFEDEDIPEKYCCQLSCAIMTDPVYDPKNNVMFEREWILRALESKKINPYTQTPLSPTDLVSAVEFRKEIDDFVEEKISNHLAKPVFD